jgi:signal transduction histidine kinase
MIATLVAGKAQGGAISCESVAGSGTTFAIELPLAREVVAA